MGFFSRKTKQRTWDDICSDLSGLLEESRKRFFRAAVEAVKETGVAAPNDALGGEGDFALKGYQLELVSAFVGRQAYVEEESLEEFDSLMLSQICGDDAEDCMGYVHRYYVQKGEANVKLLNDVVRFITGKMEIDVSIIAGLRVRERIFSTDAQIVSAVVFGDNKLAGELKSRTESAMAKLSRC